MTLFQFHVFLTVIEAGSFTKAGEELSMTQSGVSHAIAGLEAELGVTLLKRDRRGISLTEAGERILPHVRQVVSGINEIKKESAMLSGLSQGTLRIASFPSAAEKLLHGMIQSFRTRYPGVETILFEGTNPEVLEWLQSNAVHVGIVSLPCVEMEAIPLTQDELMIVLSEKHPLAQESSLAVEAILQDPFILTNGGCEPLILSIFERAGVACNIQYEVRDVGTILKMVQEQIGITILPSMALPARPSTLRYLSVTPPALRQIALAVPALTKETTAVSAFLQHAQQWIKTHPAYKEAWLPFR